MPPTNPKSTGQRHQLRRRPGLIPATAWAAALVLAAPGLNANTGYYRATEIVVPLSLGVGAPIWAVDINNHGMVAGMVLVDDVYGNAAFRWSPRGGFESLYRGDAYAINDGGVVAGTASVSALRQYGYALPDGYARAVTWNGGLNLLPTPLGADGLANSSAYAINNAGQVLYWRATGSNSAEVALNTNSQTQVVPLAWSGLQGHGHLNNDGAVLIGLNSVLTWSALAGTTDLGTLALGASVRADVINDLGVIAGSYSRGPGQPSGVFRYAPGRGVQTMVEPGLPSVSVTGMNRDGDVVGWYTRPGEPLDWTWQQAVMWRSDGALVNLNTLNVLNGGRISFSHAMDINDRGQMLVWGRDLDREPWLRRAYVISECLRCGQIAPTPNPAGATLDVGADWEDAFNAVSFENVGVLQLGTLLDNRTGGRLTNRGEVSISAQGMWSNDGQLINDLGGRLSIGGDFTNHEGAAVVNTGVAQVLDGASVTLWSSGEDGGWLNDSGSTFAQRGGLVINTGRFLASQAVLQQDRGSFSNSGQFVMLSSTASFAGTLSNSGQMLLTEDAISSPGRRSHMSLRGSMQNLANGVVTLDRGASVDIDTDGHWFNRGELKLQGRTTQLTLIAGGALTNEGGTLRVGDGSQIRIANNAGLLQQVSGRLFVARGGRIEVERSRGLDVLGGQVSTEGVIVVRSGASIANSGSFQLQVGSRLELDGGASFDQGAGELMVAAGASVLGAGLLNQIGGTTTVNGSISLPLSVFTGGVLAGNGAIMGQVALTGAVDLRPGNSTGTLTIDGDLSLDGVVYELELGEGGAHDRLIVTGHLELGRLDVALRPYGAYLPDLDDSFNFIQAANVSPLGWGSQVTLDTSALGSGWVQQFKLDGTRLRTTLDNTDAVPVWEATAGQTVHVAAGSLAWGRQLTVDGRLEVAGSFTSRQLEVDPDTGEVPCCGTMRIQPGGTLAVLAGGRFSNRADLINDGEIVNAGRFEHRPGAGITNTGRLVNQGTWRHDGTLQNQGTLANEAGARWHSHGAVENTGQITNQGEFVLRGTLDNFGGQITNQAGGRFEIVEGAVFTSAYNAGAYVQHSGGRTVVNGLMSHVAFRGNPGINAIFYGGTLEGTGTVSGQVYLGPDLDIEPAGNGIGTLTLAGGLTWFGAQLVLDIGSDSADLLDLSRAWIEPGSGPLRIQLRLGVGDSPLSGESFTLLLMREPAELDLARVSVTVSLAQAGGGFRVWEPAPGQTTRLGYDGNTLSYQVQAVPEPGTWASLLGGLAALLIAVRRRVRPETSWRLT